MSLRDNDYSDWPLCGQPGILRTPCGVALAAEIAPRCGDSIHKPDCAKEAPRPFDSSCADDLLIQAAARASSDL